jgi:hypothetical protein
MNPRNGYICDKVKRKSTVVVAESFASLSEVVTKILLVVFMVHGRFLIVLVSGEIRELEKIFKLFLSCKIYNVNAMFEDDKGEVSVMSRDQENSRSYRIELSRTERLYTTRRSTISQKNLNKPSLRQIFNRLAFFTR